MQTLVDTKSMLREGWLTPIQIKEAYRGAIDFLHAQTSIFQDLGAFSLVLGFAGLLSIPLIFALKHLNEV